MIFNIARDQAFAQELAMSLGLGVASKEAPGPYEDSVIVADLGEDLSHEHEAVVRAGIANHSAVVLRNTESQRMAKFALFGVDGTTTVLKAQNNGRRQDMIVFGAQAGPETETPPAVSQSGEAPGAALALASGLRPEPGIAAAVQAEPIRQTVEKKASESQEVAQAIEALSVRGSIAMQSASGMATQQAGLANINASQASGTVTFAQKTWHPASDANGTNTIFGAFDVELAAVLEPVKSKIVKITSRGTAVGVTKMAANNDQNRAYFTMNGLVMLYPGYDYTWDINSVALPAGWIRRAISPETPNNTSTYTKTTGWTIGAKVAGKASEKPEATAELSASYSESNSQTTTITDFRVKNESNAAVSKWKYEYSLLTDNPYATCHQPAFKEGRVGGSVVPLSQSTMFLMNESVYQAPADAVGSQRFCFYIGQTTGHLYESDHSIWSYSYHMVYAADGMWQFIDLNLGMVRHPD